MSQAGDLDVLSIHPEIPTSFVTNNGTAVPIANELDILGTVVAAGTTPLSTSGSGKTVTIKAQISQALAATDATKIGLSNFNSSQFSVDANGFVTASGTGIGQTITGDDSFALSPTAGNWNIFGQKAGSTVNAMQTHTTSSNFFIEDRTWQTQYVVDPSATVGLRGTFQTIQAAINQAITDGASSPFIYIRTGTYTENLSVPSGSFLFSGEFPWNIYGNGGGSAGIIGTMTLGATASCQIKNLFVSFIVQPGFGTVFAATNSQFLSITSSALCYLTNCFISSTGSTFSNTTHMRNCSLSTGGGGGDTATFSGSVPRHIISNCVGIDNNPVSVVVNGTSSADFIDCDNLLLTGNTSGTIRIQDCLVSGAINFPSATIDVSGISYSRQATGTALVTQIPSILFPEAEGNIASRRTIVANGNVTNNDQYVGCNKAGALAISLVNSGFIKGQELTIADESGAAATNNITITPSSGTINGSASLVISNNYGGVKIEFDGSNFFAILSPSDPTIATIPYTQITNASSPYTVLSTDYYISCDSSAGAITVRLPNAPTTTRRFIIKDRTASAAAHNITVTTVGGAVNIDGTTSYIISSNYASIQLLYNGTSYEVF